MPYIKEELATRYIEMSDDNWHQMNPQIEILIEILESLPDEQKEGAANYMISRIVAGGLKPAGGWRYMWLNRAYGTFLSAASEFYRRMVAPYEDKCIEKNGDIPEYENN